MIVTRQRKQKRSSLPILLPIAAIAMLAVALGWPPSRNIIMNGPLKPFTNIVLSFWGTVSRPLTFAGQQQHITDQNIQIKQLNDRLESERKNTADKDQQVQQLQRAVVAAQQQPEAPTPSPPPVVRATAGAGGVALPAVSPEQAALQKTGQQWAAMDPEKAAALVGTLPNDYVAKVFAQMAPDDVGPIMEQLPAKQASAIVQSGQAQLSAQAGR